MILLGLLNSQVQESPGAAGSFDLLESVFVTSNTSSVTFSNLNAYTEYQHLQIRMIMRMNAIDEVDAYINGDTGASYAGHLLRGTGGGVTSFNRFNSTILQIADVSGNSNVYTAAVTDILDFSNSSKNTTIKTLTGDSGGFNAIQIWSGLWNNAAAMTSIQFYGRSSTSFQNGSRFSLYGIKAS